MEKIYRIVVKEREGSPEKRFYPEMAIRRDDNGKYYGGNELLWRNTGVGKETYFNTDFETVQHIENKITDDEYEVVEIISYLDEAEDE